MKWLLRREMWEHKGALLWAPVIVGGAMLAFIGSLLIYAGTQGKLNDKIMVNGNNVDAAAMFAAMPQETKLQIAETAAGVYMGAAFPLFLMLGVITFFYCLGNMFEERRDRSILFWKSLPVSDTHTVLSKVITAGLVAPVITLAIGTAMSLLLLLLTGVVFAVNGVNLFGYVLSNPDFYLAPLQMFGLLPVYLLWALPTIGWLMMVSAWAKSKVFLWAVGTPVIVVVVVKWADYLLNAGINMDWLVQNVIARGLVGLIPGIWLSHGNIDVDAISNHGKGVLLSDVFTQSWMTVATPAALIGAVAGAAMIYAAIRLRRWKDEG
jgi:ABC-2 type transport system permease protein